MDWLTLAAVVLIAAFVIRQRDGIMGISARLKQLTGTEPGTGTDGRWISAESRRRLLVYLFVAIVVVISRISQVWRITRC